MHDATVQALQERMALLEAELELYRAGDERLRLMTDNAPVLLAYLDSEHRYKLVNAAYSVRYGRSNEELVGHSAREVLGEKVWEQIRPHRDRVLAGEPVEYEVDVDRGTGTPDNMRCMLNPQRDAEGKVVGYVAAIIDVTKQKRAEAAVHKSEDALREADRRKDEFLAVLAHELRNPLAPLMNAHELVRRAASGNPALRRTSEMMERQLTQLVRLVDDLLDVSRITRGRIELRRTPVSVALAIESAVESCQGLVIARGHDIQLDLEDAPQLVDGDFARLSQVFANLISNSVKYTDRGGRIEICLRHGGDDAIVTVKDTGIGIPRESLGQVFEMFSQISAHQARAAGGLGIGLALVRRLVQMHGGSISAESDGPGKGSTFTVRLPLLRPEAVRDAFQESSGPSRRNAAAQKRRVLVADDNADAAESLALLLQMQGHDTRTAADGLQAVEVAAAFRPDVIFMDVGMPRVDGIEATRRIRAEPWGNSILIVALTGWGQQNHRAQTRDVGMDLHLVKPINLDSIAAILTQS
jgi:PAS domain S-box-containing protein